MAYRRLYQSTQRLEPKTQEKRRRQYSRQAKSDALRLIKELGANVDDLAEVLDVRPATISGWPKQLESHSDPWVPCQGRPYDEQLSQVLFDKFLSESDPTEFLRVAAISISRARMACEPSLLSPDSQGDKVLAKLLQESSLSEIDFVLDVFVEQLAELAREEVTWGLENSFSPDHWRRIYEKSVAADRFHQYFFFATESFLSEATKKKASGFIAVRVGMEACWEESGSRGKKVKARRMIWRRWLKKNASTLFSNLKWSSSKFKIALCYLTNKKTARRVLAGGGLELLYRLQEQSPELAQHLVRLLPERVAELAVKQWQTLSKWESALNEDLLGLLRLDASQLEILRVELGYEIGLYCFNSKMNPKDPLLCSRFLESHEINHEPPESLVQQGTLWAVLRNLREYSKRGYVRSNWSRDASNTGRLGAEALARELAREYQAEWARALRRILELEDMHDFIDNETLRLAKGSETVRRGLGNCIDQGPSKVQDRARGLQVLIQGLEGPEGPFSRDLWSMTARQLDGSPAFPHPLEPQSSTWLGSLPVEQILRRNIDSAQRRFAPYFLDQGGIEEEACTARLLNDLENTFAASELKLSAFGDSHRKLGSAVRLSQKQVPKGEERTYGCDLSLLVEGYVHRSLDIKSTELIQVKKPVARSRTTGGFRDAWRIDIRQLEDLLGWSQTAAYWLIDPEGEVWTVAARLLKGLVDGRGKSDQGSMTIRYHEIRSAAIPLSQFLVNLVLGLWVGTSKAKILKFARGDNTRTRPRHIVVITVNIGRTQASAEQGLSEEGDER